MSTMTQWATFQLGSETFALAVEEVQEVLMRQELTPVPHAPAQMLGLLNLRGQIMPTIDLRVRLGLTVRDDDSEAKLLVLKTPEGPISVLCDEIGDVLELPAEGWVPPPETLQRERRRFVFAVCALPSGLVLGMRAQGLGFDQPDDADADAGAAAGPGRSS